MGSRGQVTATESKCSCGGLDCRTCEIDDDNYGDNSYVIIIVLII